ncbi:MAG: uridine diphosphate-N-acetylglucosamine-binding protein YvcK [Deltaproteobacteria bacterium]|nr:uridine diphosphate-N-acetylglucosamine-binding protein YvcK [Deltaproteobacteria bacterium]
MEREKQKLVTIGGGTGQFALLSGLRDLEGIEITAVVSMADSGGSTGRLRDELGILPPGDVLKCILALSPYHHVARTILLKRFTSDIRLKGHNAGNLLLTVLSDYAGSFPAGIQALVEILDVRGRILPVTIDKATLVAELSDGERVYGQAAINVPQVARREKIRDIFLVPHHANSVSVYPPVIEAIHQAEFIIIGPGDLFTSIIPNLIVPGVREAIKETRATILYVVNIMTKFGETDHFTVHDFVFKVEECVGRPVEGVIYNTGKPDERLLDQYRSEKAELVEMDDRGPGWGDRTLYASDLLDTVGGIVRHDSGKLAALIERILAG